jgi:hypothetical protein
MRRSFRGVIAGLLALMFVTVFHASAAAATVAPLQQQRIENYGSRLCLVVPDGTESRGEWLVQHRCGDAVGRFWNLVPQPNGAYHVVNGSTGQCLAVPNASTVAGEHVIQWPCSTAPDHYWTRQSFTQGYQIRNQNSGQCLAIRGGSHDIRAYAIQWPCGDWADHFWRFI